MSDFDHFDDPVGLSDAPTVTEPAPADAPTGAPAEEARAEEETPTEPEAPEESPALTRFKSCRWHESQEGDRPPYCSNRDVLPFAGKNGFSPEAWCQECDLYKVKRTAKRRSNTDDWDEY